MRRCYIGLGANLGAPAQQLRWALGQLRRLGDVPVQSSLYRSAPLGPADQPDYCNAVCRLDSSRSPTDLMRDLLAIEREAGRTRSAAKWGPRLLDLDLLHVERVTMTHPDLCLPHPGIAQRSFVLVPLAEIAPQLDLPGLGRVDELAARIDRTGLTLWTD
ncbi:MAG TPA: 2-amino-4-hydroxy-6-hydroxymethyldihydropteridine diphosphokinase [Solimonas sp.]|nr:2-amino-4-hydroxy-6-hydroxymethyldihydropteridine diphosphokinase [Solimonas sp.]